MQKLNFLAPDASTFIEALAPLWSTSTRDIRLIGANALADTLAEAAARQGVTIERGMTVPSVDTGHPLLLILTELAGEVLGQQLLACVDLTEVTIFAPVTDWHFSHKSLFLVSIPKAGTHLVYELATALGYHAGVELPEFPLGQHWYCVEYSNSHTVARDFFVDTVRRSAFGNRHHAFSHTPTLFIYRHPLDILVSEAHYYQQDGNTIFAGWLQGLTFEQRVERLLDDNWLLGSLRERIGGFLPWKEFPNVISLSFEELVGAAGGGSEAEQQQLIWSIQLKLQAPGNPREIADHVFNPNSATFRSGQLGAYKTALPADVVQRFVAENRDILDVLGYWRGDVLDFPADSAARRHKPLAYAPVDFEHMPLMLESGFMGCNLVRYARRVYAIPISAGNVALENMPQGMLAILPSAPSLTDLKVTLLLERRDLIKRKQTLNALGLALRGELQAENLPRYWSEDGPDPVILEVYRGFNLVAFRDLFLAIRQSIGPIDLSRDLADMVPQFDVDDVYVSRSLDQLRDDIDSFSTATRLAQKNRAHHAKIANLDENISTLSSEAAAAARTLHEHDVEFSAFRAELASREKRIQALEQSIAIRASKMLARWLRIKPRKIQE